MVVRFFDIDGIVDLHCLHCLFVISESNTYIIYYNFYNTQTWILQTAREIMLKGDHIHMFYIEFKHERSKNF
jgi:hypothetical protein